MLVAARTPPLHWGRDRRSPRLISHGFSISRLLLAPSSTHFPNQSSVNIPRPSFGKKMFYYCKALGNDDMKYEKKREKRKKKTSACLALILSWSESDRDHEHAHDQTTRTTTQQQQPPSTRPYGDGGHPCAGRGCCSSCSCRCG